MDDDLQILLNKRNTESAFITIKAQNEKLSEQQIRIDGLYAAVTNLSAEVSELRQMVMLMKAKITGTGPTA